MYIADNLHYVKLNMLIIITAENSISSYPESNSLQRSFQSIHIDLVK